MLERSGKPFSADDFAGCQPLMPGADLVFARVVLRKGDLAAAEAWLRCDKRRLTSSAILSSGRSMSGKQKRLASSQL